MASTSSGKPAKSLAITGKASGKSTKSSRKSASKRRKQETLQILEAPLQRYPSGEDLFLNVKDYPTDTDCLQFIANQDTVFPEHTFEYLRPIIAANTERIEEELVGPMGPVYLVRHNQDKRLRLLNFLASNIVVPGTTYGLQGIRVGLKEFKKQLDAFSPAPDAKDFESDFETPPSSSSEDETPPISARKTPAPTITPTPLTRNFLVEFRAPAETIQRPVTPPAPPFQVSTEESELSPGFDRIASQRSPTKLSWPPIWKQRKPQPNLKEEGNSATVQ